MNSFTTRPELSGTFGMVSSTHWLASAVGMSILEADGNAFDAAVATGLTLNIVEPHLNGVAGDAPIIAHHAESATTQVICGQGTSPAAATAEYFAALELDLIPGTGLLPAVVPGAFGAWMDLLARYGTLPITQIMAPAIYYARHGYPLVAQAVQTIASVEELIREHWTSTAAVYLPGGELPRVGARFQNSTLAETLERIATEAAASSRDPREQASRARDIFYRGFVAEEIASFVKSNAVMDSTGENHEGLLSFDDLSSWDPSWEEPATVDFHGYTICKTGPWGQGPVLLQQLLLLAEADLYDTKPGSAELVHTVVEGAKLSFADREAYYGDPNHVDVPLGALLSREYAGARRPLITDIASAEFQPGSPDGATPRLAEFLRRANAYTTSGAGVGEPTVSNLGETYGDTCHVDVVDRQGNMVSATPSGGWLQSSPTIPTLGFALPTRGQMFWLEQGLPNSIAPRKRPRTTLSPGMILRDGVGYLAFGTPGGDQQDQWTTSFLLNHLVYGMNLQEAIDAPNFHSTHMPSSFYPRSRTERGLNIESRMSDETVAELRRRGHKVDLPGPWSLGRISATGVRADGLFIAGANARGMQGYAVGR